MPRRNPITDLFRVRVKNELQADMIRSNFGLRVARYSKPYLIMDGADALLLYTKTTFYKPKNVEVYGQSGYGYVKFKYKNEEKKDVNPRNQHRVKTAQRKINIKF